MTSLVRQRNSQVSTQMPLRMQVQTLALLAAGSMISARFLVPVGPVGLAIYLNNYLVPWVVALEGPDFQSQHEERISKPPLP
jgi:hypothetical protein